MGHWARPLLLLLLLACLVSITPLAYASPPDPTWTDGFYDDDDGDDIVVSLSWAAWAAGAPPPAADAPPLVVVCSVAGFEPVVRSIASPSAFLGRAPPHA
jgi:hypothetical protein